MGSYDLILYGILSRHGTIAITRFGEEVPHILRLKNATLLESPLCHRT